MVHFVTAVYTWITLNRPEKKNALTQAMYAAVIDHIQDANENANIRVVVLSALGSVFTSGNDLTDFATSVSPAGETTPAAKFPYVLAEAKKPILVSVNGPAVGVGVTLIAQCDLSFASENATFRTPFVDLALVPEGASSLMLPAAVGRLRANELLLLGATWTAADAKAAGLINQVYAQNEIHEKVRAHAAYLATRAPGALRKSKEMLQFDPAVSRKRIAEAEQAFAGQLSSAEFGEAISAFMARRKPDFANFQ
jgi:enoyl-CoA hydratase/carnithine racemase